MPQNSRCGSGILKTPQFLARGITAEKLMPASISAVGLSLRARPRDPTTTVRRRVEGAGDLAFAQLDSNDSFTTYLKNASNVKQQTQCRSRGAFCWSSTT